MPDILHFGMIDSHNIVDGNTDTSGINLGLLADSVELIILLLQFFLSSSFQFKLLLNSFLFSLNGCFFKTSLNVVDKVLLKILDNIKNSQPHVSNIIVSLFNGRSQRITAHSTFILDQEN